MNKDKVSVGRGNRGNLYKFRPATEDSNDDDELITRDNMRLWKLTDRNSGVMPALVELEFYQFKGGKTKSVRNRIIRLEKAIDIMSR